MALNSLSCADVLLRSYSLPHAYKYDLIAVKLRIMCDCINDNRDDDEDNDAEWTARDADDADCHGNVAACRQSRLPRRVAH